MKIIEIKPNQILALQFISLGSDAVIGFEEIKNFFDILRKVNKCNVKHDKYSFIINMPMHDNFDATLFSEITEGNNKGKYELVKPRLFKNNEIVKEKLTKYFMSLTGKDKDMINEYKVAMNLLKEQHDAKVLCEVKSKQLNKENLFVKVRRMIKRNG